MMFDTDVLIWYSRGDRLATDLIESCAERAISIVSYMEIIQGARSKAEMRAIQRTLRSLQFHMIPVDEPVSYLALDLIEEHALGDGLEILDALIAASARHAGEELATGNIRHFRQVPQLALRKFRPASETGPVR